MFLSYKIEWNYITLHHNFNEGYPNSVAQENLLFLREL